MLQKHVFAFFACAQLCISNFAGKLLCSDSTLIAEVNFACAQLCISNFAGKLLCSDSTLIAEVNFACAQLCISNFAGKLLCSDYIDSRSKFQLKF